MKRWQFWVGVAISLIFLYIALRGLGLRDLGEAYYRWQPRTSEAETPWERALVAWLTGRLQDMRLGNRIELVRPGERFDASRHVASQRGVVVETVRGWVVLRGNGKVYTKASVTVK